MEYISAEEFIKQDKEIQKVFLDWWKSNATEFDLLGYIGKSPAYKRSFPSLVRNVAIDCFELNVEIVPLFTEGQLRKFIEDETECKLDIEYFSADSILFRFRIGRKEKKSHMFYDTKSLLQAYWKVALKIAKENL